MKFFDDEVPDRSILDETKYKIKKLSPFEWVDSIYTNKYIMEDLNENQYEPYMVNKALSMGADTTLPANEMNRRYHADKRLQYDYLINKVTAKKRYNKWIKAETVEAVESVQEYYGYSKHKALQVLPLLSESDLEKIKKRLRKGGLNGG